MVDGLSKPGGAPLVGAVDEDDPGPVPEFVEPGDFHVLGHEPADLESAGGLDEDGVHACGVVGDDDEGAWGFGFGDVRFPIDAEAVDEAGVDLHDADDDAGEDVIARGGAHRPPDGEGEGEEGDQDEQGGLEGHWVIC